jgi:septal ring factor EnvC (AmiA/AmiB activator)
VPKKIALISGATLLIVIIAASSYFFLSAKQAPVEAASHTSEPIETMSPSGTELAAGEQKNDQQINTLQSEVFDLREQVIQLKEQNLVLKKQIYDLETQKPSSPQQLNNDPTKQSSYKKVDPLEFKDYPPIEPAVHIEKPKPKWG